VISLGLARVLHRLRDSAHELEAREPEDEATLPLLKMIGLKVVRLERTN
jgi:hypothetical protein